MHTYNVTLSATYTVNAENEEQAISRARLLAEVSDLDAGYGDVEEIDYDSEYDY